MTAGVFGQVLLIVTLIVINGLFALSEMALVTVRPTQVGALVEQGVRGARRVQRVTKDPSRFLSTIQVTITLSGFLASASATASLSAPLSRLLASWGVPASWTGGLAILLVTGAVSYLSLVFGELVPKQLALRAPAATALRVAPLVDGLAAVFHPFVRTLSASTQLVLKVLRVTPTDSRTNLSVEELRRLVVEHRTLETDEKEMIESIFQFGDAEVRDVLIPRADVVGIADDRSVSEAVSLVLETGFSRFPVYAHDLDRIVGIVTVKDLLAALVHGEGDGPVKGLCRPPLVVPERKNALALLQEMRRQRTHMAVVVDEYGSTAGIVTIEDLLEEIVGDIQDETDPEPQQRMLWSGENEMLVDADVQMDDVVEMIGKPVHGGEARSTLAGFLLARLQRIPEEGESFDYGGVRFIVATVDGYRIEQVRITVPDSTGSGRPGDGPLSVDPRSP